MQKLWVVLICCCLMASVATAQHPGRSVGGISIDNIELGYGQNMTHRYLGGCDRGAFVSRDAYFSMGSGHRNLVLYSLTSNDHSEVDLSGLSANARTRALGINVPISRFTFRFTDNSWVSEPNDSTVDAYGIYFEYRPTKSLHFEGGVESFYRQAPGLYYLMSFVELPTSFRLASGVSARYVQEGGLPHHFEERIMVGGVLPISQQPKLYLSGGLAVRTDSATGNAHTNAWLVSVAIPASDDSTSFWKASGYAVFYKKPRSRRLMLMGSIGGDGFGPHSIYALQRSGFRTLMVPTRVVNNQNFYIGVLTQHTQEFGVISYYLVWFKFDINENVSAESYKGSLFLTAWNWKKGCLGRPFIGYTRYYEEDIIFNPMKRQLESIGHYQHIIEAGIYVKAFSNTEDSYGRGNVRLSLIGTFGSDGTEGAAFNASVWF